MALITRVSRLLQADLHAVLDHIEEPGVRLEATGRGNRESGGLSEVPIENNTERSPLQARFPAFFPRHSPLA